MKQILFFTFLFVLNSFAQSGFPGGRERIQTGNYYKSEIHCFRSGDEFYVSYIYKIPYSQLYFEKKDDEFISGLKINLEIEDTAGNIVKRAFDDKIISAGEYESTISSDLLLQGTINFQVREGKYRIAALISERISRLERKLPPQELSTSTKDIILHPIVAESVDKDITSPDTLIISNNSFAIPFNHPDYDLIIPVIDTAVGSINVKIRKSAEELYSEQNISDHLLIRPEIMSSEDRIILTDSPDRNPVKLFYIDNFSSFLDEGPVSLEIIPDYRPANKTSFNLNVAWIGKPYSLMDADRAIKYLEIFESRDKISELKRGKDSEEQILYDYWRKMDISPDTKYNELMNEFYQRVDFAESEFRLINGNGGAFSDRGKIYIKFGQPDEILRDTNIEGKVVESWYYDESKRIFVFVDKDGTGKFPLVNQQ